MKRSHASSAWSSGRGLRNPKALAVVCAGMLAAGLYLHFGVPPASRTVTLGTVRIAAEVVVTAVDQERGLSGRVGLPDGQGMLFVFPKPDRYVFWMPDMKFPIDIVWIDKATIVDIAGRVPPPAPGTPRASLPTYTPRFAADRVLEVPAGTVEKSGAKIGDAVKGL